RIPQIREGESADGWTHIENGRARAKSKNHRKQYGDANGNANPEPQVCSSKVCPFWMTILPRRLTGVESLAFSLLEHDRRSISNQVGDPRRVPVCHPHAPVRRGMANFPRFRRAVYSIVGYVDPHPDHA